MNNLVKPANQILRLWVLRLTAIMILPLFAFAKPIYGDDTIFFELFEIAGIFLVIGGVLGRFWSILYIGGQKNKQVMQIGPYSICRHPLYLFSTISVLGFGLMTGVVILAIIITAITFVILYYTAIREEEYLVSEFASDYKEYAKTTPRILPKLSNFRTPGHISVNTSTLRTNTFDAIVFLSLIPLAEFLEYIKDLDILPSITLF